MFEVFPDNPEDPSASGVKNLEASLRRVLATKQADTMPVQKYDIRQPDVRFVERWWSPVNAPVLDRSGEIVSIIHHVHDLTDYMPAQAHGTMLDQQTQRLESALVASNKRLAQAAEELRASEQFARLTIEGVKDHAIFTTDADGVITAWPAGAAEVFGWGAQEALGRNFEMLFTPEDRSARIPSEELAEARQIGCADDDRWHVRKDGALFLLRGTTRPLRDRSDRLAGFIKVGRDDTQRRALEAERERAEASLRQLNESLEKRVEEEVAARLMAEDALRQSQKLEAIGQLTGGLAHDFNNLLTVIRSAADLLRRPELSEQKRERYVAAISETADRAAKLTGQLLAFSRRQSLRPEVLDMAARLDAVLEMIRTTVGPLVEVEADVRCRTCFVEADVTQLDTALLNLAANARDAMGGKGKLTIRLESVTEVPPTRGHGVAPGDFAALSISDTGHGIPSEQSAQVFEPFFTTKEVGKGTGLGLSQVYGFAKQSGGQVRVESEVGCGATFTLYLPRTPKLPVAASAQNQAAIERARGRILVVEDNTSVAEFSAQLLEELGFDPVLATNANSALKLIDDPQAHFDVVFSDVIMPGLTGIELGREIKRRHPNLPVVLTSGYSHGLASEGAHEFELLHKPYTAEGLMNVLQRAMAR